MLTFSKLSKGFGPKTLFTDISFRILQGERIGLVGPNGAGKTTLFSIILGNTEPDQGKVELDRGTVIGFLPQESAPPQPVRMSRPFGFFNGSDDTFCCRSNASFF